LLGIGRNETVKRTHNSEKLKKAISRDENKEVMNMEKNNKPEKHFRFGGIRVSVWCDMRKGPTGQEFASRSVTMDRAFKDASGQWQNTHSLKENDLPKAIAALQKAYEFMTQKKGDGEEDGGE
jgi:hypothetical protein